jgi:predicted nucleic acid-binding protein
MIYIDSSCLYKLLAEEAQSFSVRRAVAKESIIVVSSLAELETEVQLKNGVSAGDFRVSQFRHYQAQLVALRNLDPFHFRHLPSSLFQTALRQHRRPDATYCRSVDRLHLAAMEELKLTRLMTLDKLQAKAAEALGFEILFPGQE